MKNRVLITLILLVLNYNVFYQFYTIDNSLFYILYELIVYFVVFFFLLNLFSFSKIINKIWIVLLFIIAIIEIYFINSLGLNINNEVIKNTINTNIQEATELLNSSFYIYIIINISMLIIIYKYFIANIYKVNIKVYLILFISTLIIFFSLTKIDYLKYRHFIKYHTDKIAPLNFFPAMQKYISRLDRNKKITKTNISNTFKFNNKKTPLIVVVIIGESARADRFSINGYNKPTTPNLQNLQNIISFTNATSCDTSTMSSVPCMVQRFTHKTFSFPIQETSFVKVFRDFGFDTYWLTLQNEAKVIDTFCKEAKHCIDLSNKTYDTQSLQNIQAIVKQAVKNTLIVVHTMGSHFNYNSRVEPTNMIFKPIQQDGKYKAGIKLNNSYDNTIYQTDIFLSKLINLIKTKNSFLLYSSDHGESLGEKQYGVFERYGHASPYDVAPQEQTNIPFILWYSNKFLNQSHLKLNTIKQKRQISHDFIFSTILGCSGFRGHYIKDKYNLCKDK